VDGKCGPVTKALLTNPRFDGEKDTALQAHASPYKPGQVVRYFVGVSPVWGKKPRANMLADIHQALSVWQQPCGLAFRLVGDENDCDLRVTWSADDDDDDEEEKGEHSFSFDGQGQVLAHAGVGGDGVGFITLDSGEKWVTHCQWDGTKRRRGEVVVRAVVLHEFGHVLGLVHAKSPHSAMAPFYKDNQFWLTKTDSGDCTTILPFDPSILYCDLDAISKSIEEGDTFVSAAELTGLLEDADTSPAGAEMHIAHYLTHPRCVRHEGKVDARTFMKEYTRMAIFKAIFACRGRPLVPMGEFESALTTFTGATYASKVVPLAFPEQTEVTSGDLDQWYARVYQSSQS